MNKNIIITYLIIVIVGLMGFIIITSFDLFSEVWFIGLGIILIGIVVGGVIAYFKIVRKAH